MSKNDEYDTPEFIYGALGDICLDPCASNTSNIAKVNIRNKGGLSTPWQGFVFCNPPFSNKKPWIERMVEHNHGILLLPERGSAPWFVEVADNCSCIFTLGKKISFEGGTSTNTVGTCLFGFGPYAYERLYSSGLPGVLTKVMRTTTREQAARRW